MCCPYCRSDALRKLSLIHAAGSYESRGRFRGRLTGDGGLLFGQYRGQSQNVLSLMTAPPKKMRFLVPTILWLFGFFPVMAFASRGKISTLMAIFSAGYVCLLPSLLIAAFVYNLFVYPAKYRLWDQKFMCQRCGMTSDRHALIPVPDNGPINSRPDAHVAP
jgi:hypothetical protein